MTYFILNKTDKVRYRTDRSYEDNYLPYGVYILEYSFIQLGRCKIRHIELDKSYYVNDNIIYPYKVTKEQVLETIKVLYEN